MINVANILGMTPQGAALDKTFIYNFYASLFVVNKNLRIRFQYNDLFYILDIVSISGWTWMGASARRVKT